MTDPTPSLTNSSAWDDFKVKNAARVARILERSKVPDSLPQSDRLPIKAFVELLEMVCTEHGYSLCVGVDSPLTIVDSRTCEEYYPGDIEDKNKWIFDTARKKALEEAETQRLFKRLTGEEPV